MIKKRLLVLLFVLLMVFLLVIPAFAGSKKFNVCLDRYESKTLIKYGGLEIVAECDFPAYLYSTISFRSEGINTRTTHGFYPNPFNYTVSHATEGSCNTDDEGSAMTSEKGHYLSIPRGTLVICAGVANCECSFTGVIEKDRIKQK